MYQQTMIVGNVGRDPEMRYTSSGVPVCSFSVAVNKSWTDKNSNEKRDKTTWFRVTAWRQLGETCSQYVRKGMRILIVGEIEASAYLAQDGEARANLELTARDVKFLSSRDESGGGSGSYGTDDSYQEYIDEVDDIPF
jgi:single-strand DNA-binding protein